MVLTLRLLLVALGLSVVIVAFPGQQTLWLCLLALGLLVAADMLLAASPRRLRVERVTTEPVRLDQRSTAVTVVHHTGSRRLRGSAKDGWQPSAGALNPVSTVSITPGQSTRLRTVLRPRRRGDLTSQTLAVRSIGPLGLAGRQVTHRTVHRQRVLPPFRSRRHLPSKRHRLRELDGQTAVQIRGAGTEFDSLRDYVRGDDVRSIDWRATARRQHLVVRTWRPERDRRVVLCLDASRTSAARVEDEPRLDTGIEAALLLGVLAAGAGDRVDLLGFDRRLVTHARSSANGDCLHTMVSALAPIHPELVEADFSQLPGHVGSVTTQRSLVVILTSLDSASFEEGLLPVLPALTQRHLVLIASVQDPDLARRTVARETVGEVYRAAAAERSLIERQALRAQLSSLGVEVVEAPPHQLPPELADAYIRLKAAGRL